MAQTWIIDINRSARQKQAVFNPPVLVISNGDQVAWRNNDPRPSDTPKNPKPDPQSHQPAPVGGQATDWLQFPIPGKRPSFDPVTTQGVVAFTIPAPAAGAPPTTQDFVYQDATGNTKATGTIRVFNPAPPTTLA